MKQKKQRNQKKMEERNADIPELCLKDSVLALYNGLYKKASNFERQVKRIEKRVPIIDNKLLKAGEYKQAARNMANAPCPPEAAPAAELLSIELGTCEKSITVSCQPPVYSQTLIDECKPEVEAFTKELDVCEELTGEEACNCWQSDIFSDLYESVLDCVIKESEANVTERFKECKNAVGDCNKLQTEAFNVYVECYNIQKLDLECPEVGVSCINPDDSNVIKIIENSSIFNCSKNIILKI